MDMTLTLAASPRKSRSFLIGFAVPCLVAALLVAFSAGVLYSNGEQFGPDEAARMQQEQGGLYGSALTYRPYPYKLERYRLTQPDIAVIGSSRAMAFLAAGFDAPMINLGGAVNKMYEGENLVADMLAAHKPKLVIVTIDYWWFNKSREEKLSGIETGTQIHFTLEHFVAPYRWLATGKASLSGLLQTFRDAVIGKPGSAPRIGALANQSNEGFDFEGAYHYGDRLTGAVKHPDRHFKQTLKRLGKNKKNSKLSADADFSDETWNGLLHLDGVLRQAGVTVRYILPPLAGPAYAEIRGQGTGLVNALHDHLEQSGLPFYDFTDPQTLGSPDCEFEDGLHGGFVTALRMLRAISSGLDATPAARGLVKPTAELDHLIAANAGRATLRDEAWSGTETDFLELGCAK